MTHEDPRTQTPCTPYQRWPNSPVWTPGVPALFLLRDERHSLSERTGVPEAQTESNPEPCTWGRPWYTDQLPHGNPEHTSAAEQGTEKL